MIIFLRHGQAENNVKRILAGRTGGVTLTKTGIEQAGRIAKYLKPLDISAIYSSPIERAKHTAEIVAENNSLDFQYSTLPHQHKPKEQLPPRHRSIQPSLSVPYFTIHPFLRIPLALLLD